MDSLPRGVVVGTVEIVDCKPSRKHDGFECLAEMRLIDPACGSGTMLLQAFARLVGAWKHAQPDSDPIERVRRVLDQLAGVDQNPAAAAIARFRLLVAALRELAEAERFGLFDLDRAERMVLKRIAGDFFRLSEDTAPGEVTHD